MVKWLGIIAFVAVIGFFLVACPMTGDNDKDGESSDSAISLPEDDYSDGAITSANKEQWFKFTATTSTHYIHVVHGTLSDFSVQLHDSNKSAIGGRVDYHQSQLNGYTGWYTEVTVTRGKVYYLKVTPYSSSGTGTYRIACNTMVLSPGSLRTAKILASDTWIAGSITLNNNDEDDLYRFTATSATTHYIHINFGTLTQVYVRLYDSSGSILQNRTSLSSSGYIPYQFLTSGSVYYVALWSTSSTGTYQVAFSTSTTAPQ